MKAFSLFLLLAFNLFAVHDYQNLVDSISQHAIRIGIGPNKIYTFVDPLCSKSQLFIELINTRKDLQKKNSYYIFLYRLPKFNSESYIHYIYQSQHRLESLNDIMIYEDYGLVEDFKVDKKTLEMTDDIARVAKELKMKRRPYLLIFDAGSSYCRVSEGTAPCMEDSDLE